jgi:hypothetical protein
MGSKGYFNPRLKLKDLNKKKHAFIQKPIPKRSNEKRDSQAPWYRKRA